MVRTSAPLRDNFTVLAVESTLKMPYSTFRGRNENNEKQRASTVVAEFKSVKLYT